MLCFLQGGGDIGTVPLNVTAMCLLGEENENSMLQLVTGGLHGQVCLLCAPTICELSANHAMA